MRYGVLHRWLVICLAAAVLYGGAPVLAREEAVTSPVSPPPSLDEPVPLPPDGSAPAVRAWIAQPPTTGGGVSHIALVLPLNSSAFGKHAEAVANGFHAAAKVQGGVAL